MWSPNEDELRVIWVMPMKKGVGTELLEGNCDGALDGAKEGMSESAGEAAGLDVSGSAGKLPGLGSNVGIISLVGSLEIEGEEKGGFVGSFNSGSAGKLPELGSIVGNLSVVGFAMGTETGDFFCLPLPFPLTLPLSL